MAGVMADNILNYTMDRMPRGTTIVVRFSFSPSLRRRIWLAVLLFRLGAWVMGCPLEMVESTESESRDTGMSLSDEEV